MNPTRKIARVFVVADRCTVSAACEVTCPEVFHVMENSVVVRDDAPKYYVAKRDAIEEAAEGCPLEAIQIEYEDGSLLPEPSPAADAAVRYAIAEASAATWRKVLIGLAIGLALVAALGAWMW